MLSTSYHDLMHDLHIKTSISVTLKHVTAVLMLRATITKDHATAHVKPGFPQMDKCTQVNFAISLIIQVKVFLTKSERIHKYI